MENATKLSIQNFDFQNFVTEIFSFKIHIFFSNFKNRKILKMADFKPKNFCDKTVKIKNMN